MDCLKNRACQHKFVYTRQASTLNAEDATDCSETVKKRNLVCEHRDNELY